MNRWEKEFGIVYPECKRTGQCCKCVSPSTPAVELLKKASENNEFARDFFSVFVPFDNIGQAKKVNPEWVQKAIEHCRKPDSKISDKDLYFYVCRYVSEDNKCLIWEDRPQFCRDYPDSPFLILAPGCAYENWSNECRKKYNQLKEELEYLKNAKKELENIQYQQKSLNLLSQLQKIDDKNYKFMLLNLSLSLVSPGRSWIKFF